MTSQNLDFVLRLIVAPIQAEGARILAIVAVLVLGYFAVSWFDMELVKVVTYGFAFVVAIGAYAWCAAMGMGYMGNCALAAFALFVWKSDALFDVILPKEAALTVTANVPAKVDFHLSDGNAFLIGNVTNLSDRQLQYATVSCWGTYKNGKRAERPWAKQVGDTGWTLPGQSTRELRLIALHDLKPEKFDLSKTTCEVAEATFRDMPAALPSFTFGEDRASGYTHFEVRNDTPKAVTHVRFSCLHAGNGAPVSEQPEPIYQEATEYVLAPGETIELRSKNKFPDLEDCRVYSVDGADPA